MDLLKKDRKWKWIEACQQTFDKLKQAVASKPMLKLPNFNLSFEIHMDASDKAIGGVLIQEGHLIAFESWKLKDAEQQYSAHENEMMVVVHCLGIWKHYLLDIVLSIVTNNMANTYFKT